MKVIAYGLAMNQSLELMIKEVAEYTDNGYEPVGGLIIDEGYKGKTYIQTMVKYKRAGRPKLFGGSDD